MSDVPAAGAAEEPEAELPTAVRQRLISIASAALGSLEAADIPRSLRAVARFTPVKRARLGAAGIERELASDSDFRAAVVTATVFADPAQVQDPIERAVIAYLQRPAGWRQDIPVASGRPRDADRAPRTGRLDRDLRAARERARREAAESARLRREIGDAQRQVRSLTGDVRRTGRERDAALAELSQLRDELGVERNASQAELRRLRSALERTERAASEARGRARSDRSADDARLWLLLETLGGATRGLREELAVAPTEWRPADPIATERSNPPGAGDAPYLTLEALLTLPNVHLIVDGYNVTKTGYGDLPLAAQRERLVRSLSGLAAQTGAEMTCVFDGGAGPAVQPAVPRSVRVIFSSVGEIADEVIGKLVCAEPTGRAVVVVSSDGEVAADARAAGFWSVPSAALLARLTRS